MKNTWVNNVKSDMFKPLEALTPGILQENGDITL